MLACLDGEYVVWTRGYDAWQLYMFVCFQVVSGGPSGRVYRVLVCCSMVRGGSMIGGLWRDEALVLGRVMDDDETDIP